MASWSISLIKIERERGEGLLFRSLAPVWYVCPWRSLLIPVAFRYISVYGSGDVPHVV
jgi:hypothetical protein